MQFRGRRIWMLALFVLLTAVLAGCSTQPAANTAPAASVREASQAIVAGDSFSVLQQESDKYLKLNKPLLITAREVYEKVVLGGDQGYYLVDIRGDEHYAAAHIPGSIHIAYTDTWRENKWQYLPKDKKIVVICYSGHTASQAAALWGMLGLDTVVMKHGMAAWSKDKETIGASPLACVPNDYPVVAGETESSVYDIPKLDNQAPSALKLLVKQAAAAAEKPVVLQPQEVRAKLGSSEQYIVDIRSAEHYRKGHIAGAVHIPFRNLLEPENLRKLPPDKKLVLVCYDGHAASQAARLLNQLGYDAVALKDGMSIWTHDENIIGAKAIACSITENLTVKLNAVLTPGAAAAAT